MINSIELSSVLKIFFFLLYSPILNPTDIIFAFKWRLSNGIAENRRLFFPYAKKEYQTAAKTAKYIALCSLESQVTLKSNFVVETFFFSYILLISILVSFVAVAFEQNLSLSPSDRPTNRLICVSSCLWQSFCFSLVLLLLMIIVVLMSLLLSSSSLLLLLLLLSALLLLLTNMISSIRRKWFFAYFLFYLLWYLFVCDFFWAEERLCFCLNFSLAIKNKKRIETE